jgi:hypothetical protein
MSRRLNGNSHLASFRPVPLLVYSRTSSDSITTTATVDSETPRATPLQSGTNTEYFPAELEHERSLFALTESDATHSLSNYSRSMYDESVADSYFDRGEEVSSFDQLRTTPETTEGAQTPNPFTRELSEIRNMLGVLSELETSLSRLRGQRLWTTLSSSSLPGLSGNDASQQLATDWSYSPTHSHTSEVTSVGADVPPPPIPPKSPARRVAMTRDNRHVTRTATPGKRHKWLSLLGFKFHLNTPSHQGVGAREVVELEPKGLRQKLRHSFSKMSLRQ